MGASLIPPTWPILIVTPVGAPASAELDCAMPAKAPQVIARTLRRTRLLMGPPSLFDPRAGFLRELRFAVRAAQLPFRVTEIFVVAVEALLAEWAGDPEDPRHGLDPPQLVMGNELFELDAAHRLGRHLDARLEGPAHRAGRVDDHLRPPDVVALRRIERGGLDGLD